MEARPLLFHQLARNRKSGMESKQEKEVGDNRSRAPRQWRPRHRAVHRRHREADLVEPNDVRRRPTSEKGNVSRPPTARGGGQRTCNSDRHAVHATRATCEPTTSGSARGVRSDAHSYRNWEPRVGNCPRPPGIRKSIESGRIEYRKTDTEGTTNLQTRLRTHPRSACKARSMLTSCWLTLRAKVDTILRTGTCHRC